MSDNYLSFNYKNESYSTTAYSLYNDFNGFIINEGTDLTFFNPSNFSHEFMTPQFGNQNYFMGTTQENREFTFSILLKDVSLATYKNFLRWLNPRDEGKLYFDYNSQWGYDVKVNTISEAKFTVNPNCDSTLTYNIELTVGFITKNDYAATLVATVSTTSLPSGGATTYLNLSGSWTSSSTSAVLSIYNSTTSTYIFNNLCNEEAYLKITGSTLTALSINLDTIPHYIISSTTALDLILYTEYGIAVDDSTNDLIPFITNLGKLTLPPLQPTTLAITATASSLIVLPVVREII